MYVIMEFKVRNDLILTRKVFVIIYTPYAPGTVSELSLQYGLLCYIFSIERVYISISF